MKWRLTRKAEGQEHYILCNADEGEPGTFKDRMLLAEFPNLVFDGMTIAGYALGSKHGAPGRGAGGFGTLANLPSFS